MSDDSGLRDQLLEKNEISDSYYHVDQQSDSMMVEEQNNDNSENDSLQTKHSKYVYYNSLIFKLELIERSIDYILNLSVMKHLHYIIFQLST